MDKTLHETKNTFTFLDNILILTKGSKEELMNKVEETIKVLDEAGVQLRVEIRKTAQNGWNTSYRPKESSQLMIQYKR